MLRRNVQITIIIKALCILSSTEIFLNAPPAEAKEAQDFVSLGIVSSITAREDRNAVLGAGLEVGFVHYPGLALRSFGYGGYANLQNTDLGYRGSLGLQCNYIIFGLASGLVLESGGDSFSDILGLEVMPFLSVGLVSLAFRYSGTTYAFSDSKTPLGHELGAVLAIKYPIALGGQIPEL